MMTSQGAVITGRLFSIRSTGTAASQAERPLAEVESERQTRLERELKRAMVEDMAVPAAAACNIAKKQKSATAGRAPGPGDHGGGDGRSISEDISGYFSGDVSEGKL